MDTISAVTAVTEGIAVQTIATEALDIISDAIKDLTDAIQKALDEHDELTAMQEHYNSCKNAIDALSNYAHASYRNPSARRQR